MKTVYSLKHLLICFLLGSCSQIRETDLHRDIDLLMSPNTHEQLMLDLKAHSYKVILASFTQDEKLKAIRYLGSHGTAIYFLFLEDQIVASTIHGKIFNQKAIAQYSTERLDNYFEHLEQAGICSELKTKKLKNNDELAIYRKGKKLRVCSSPRLAWGTESDFMTEFWQIQEPYSFKYYYGGSLGEPTYEQP